MIADFFTKPLQGQHFKRLRDVVMGAKHYSTLNHSKEKIQERVGKGEVIKNVHKQVRFSSDIIENKRRHCDPKGVDVNKFSTKYRKRIEGINGLRFTSSIARMDSTKKAYVEVLKTGLTRFKNPCRKVRNVL